MPKKYEHIYNDILSKISDGEYKLDSVLPTEKYFTEYYNVSRITVQKALNILVQDGIVERIAGKGSFVKKIPGNIMANNSGNNYAIVVPFQEYETMTIIKGAQDVISQNNSYLTVQFTDYNNSKENDEINKLIQHNIKNIILYPLFSDLNVELYKRLISNGANIVFIDKKIKNFPSNTVLSNNFQGAYDATQYLIDSGHKNIAFLSYDKHWGDSLIERQMGFRQCMSDNSLLNDSILINDSMNSEFEVPEIMDKFIKNRNGATAVFCSTDALAAKVIYYLKEHNIRVPEDISIMGFDNGILAQTVRPRLTTVSQNYYEIGRCAAELLIYAEKNNYQNLNKIMIPTKIEVRDSVKKIG